MADNIENKHGVDDLEREVEPRPLPTEPGLAYKPAGLQWSAAMVRRSALILTLAFVLVPFIAAPRVGWALSMASISARPSTKGMRKR